MLDSSVSLHALNGLAPVLEETFERKNDGSHGNANASHPISQRVIFGNGQRSLIQRYVEHEVGICFDWHAGPIPGEAKGGNFILAFQSMVSNGIHFGYRDALGQLEYWPDSRRPRSDDMKLSMPIRPCPVMKESEGAIVVGDHQFGWDFGNLVRLYRLDNGLQLVRQWRDVPGRFLKLRRAGTERKRKGLFIAGRIFTGFQHRRRVNATVKGCPEVVKALPQSQRNAVGERSFRPDNDAPIPATVNIHSSAIGISFSKPIPGPCEVSGPYVCPFDALPAPLEW